MHLASSSKVERLADVSARLVQEGYDAGYRQGRIRGFSVGTGAGFILAVAIWMGLAMVAANAEPREVAHEVCITPEQVAENYRRVPGLWHVWELQREHIELLRTGLDETVEGDSGIVAERPDILTAQVTTFLDGCALGRYMMDRKALEQALTSKML